MSLSVITPTIGRRSLQATAASVLPQLAAGDEWIVVGDGPQPAAAGLCREARVATQARLVYAEAKHATSQFGNAQRDLALTLAKATHVCFVDDDDVWNPGAGDAMREALDLEPHAVHVWKAGWGSGHHWQGVLWREPVFVQGNVGTPMVVYPRSHALPRFMDFNRHGTVSDFAWMSAALGTSRLRWHTRIVATVRPEAV